MPPLPLKIAPPLNGVKKGTFVFETIKNRWPRILTQVIDQVHRFHVTHTAVYAEAGDKDIKAVIHELSEMKYEMQTDKPLRDFEDEAENYVLWNDQLNNLRKEASFFIDIMGDENVTWYKAAWLFVECYLYARIVGAFAKTSTLTHFDPFTTKKQNAFVDSLDAIEIMAKELTNIIKESSTGNEIDTISRMIQVSLWGNKCDLSLSAGNSVVSSKSPLEQVTEFADKILLNDIEEAIKIINGAHSKRIDIVLDNAGLELFEDLLLSEFLLLKDKASKIVFHGKVLPWFVSDVTNNDFFWLMEMLLQSRCDQVKELGLRWKEHLESGTFEFRAHTFWTLPFDYSEMAKYAPDLYQDMSSSALIFFKGDLNYRKLVGDRDWPLDTPYKNALRGFNPAPHIALRTLKAETQVGLSNDIINRLEREYKGEKNWMVSGEYAVAQLSK